MKNIAIIFAGGSGSRMNTRSKPKQFLELHGKPIIIYTLEIFEKHPEIDGMVVVCIEDWILYLQKLLKRFEITKVVEIVPGGATGQESIYNGLSSAVKHYPQNSLVLIHDGVRPLIYDTTISDNIAAAKKFGSSITCVPTTETLVIVNDDNSLNIPPRSKSLLARAPQTYILSEIWEAHQKARAEGINNFIDSCTMMNYYGKKLHTIMGPAENIKITTSSDYYIFRAIEEVRENQQIFGL
ncbi:MAG: 2-C-methyl-D-erythritol 4-phosphate cytidylyltransferase [Paludibacter sp.]|nr:2-C-methyl-D-erythritol 4-phosphate cytidylyltransferase [Paludibacter sp.]